MILFYLTALQQSKYYKILFIATMNDLLRKGVDLSCSTLFRKETTTVKSRVSDKLINLDFAILGRNLLHVNRYLS